MTDDLKKDWWWIESGRTVGPRPELLSEFASRSGQRIWQYTSEGFLRAAKRYVGADVPDQLLEEVRNRLEEERARQQEMQDKPKKTDVTTLDEEKMSAADDEKMSAAPTDKLRDGPEATKAHSSPPVSDDGEVRAADKPNASSENEGA